MLEEMGVVLSGELSTFSPWDIEAGISIAGLVI